MSPYARTLAAIFALFAFLIFAGGANAQQGGIQFFQAWQPSGQATLAVSNTTARSAFGSQAPVAWVCNTGTVNAYVALGDVTVTAAVVSGQPILAGQCSALLATNRTYLAGLTASGTTTLLISTGFGNPAAAAIGSSSGGGGSVTQGTSPWVVSGTVAATQGTSPWVISGALTDAQLRASAVPATVAGVATAANQASILTALGSPLQAGGNVNATLSAETAKVIGTVNQGTSPWVMAGTVQPGNTPNTTPWLFTRVPQAGAASAIVPSATQVAASNSVLCAAPCNLYDLTVTIGATSGWIMLFDAVALPSNGATGASLKWCWPANSNGTVGGLDKSWGAPLRLATGLVAAFSGTACNTLTASATAFFYGQVQ